MAPVRSTVTIAHGETVSLVRDEYRESYVAYEYQPNLGPAPVNFFNYGTIQFTTNFAIDPYAILWIGGDSMAPGSVVENHGVIFVEAKIGYASGFLGGRADFTNTGQITIRGERAAEGLRTWDRLFTNHGDILVEARDEALVLLSSATDPILNSGEIIARVTGAGFARAVQIHGAASRIENDGLIAAYHPSRAGSSLGISFGAGIEPMRIINRGVITADDALLDTSHPVHDSRWTSAQLVENSGRIDGRISLGLGSDSLTNTNRINGAVDLGAGEDLYDGRLGQTLGMVGGGDGADTLRGGTEFDYLHGNAGADSVSGGPGDDWVVGGKDADSLSGDAGADVVYANLGADTGLGGEGADWIRGGQDNDSLSGGGGDDLMWGDRGDDTLSGGAGADTFNIFAGAGLDRILDFSLADGDRVRIEGGAAHSVRSQGGDTIVDLGGGDQLVVAGVDLTGAAGWILTS